MVLDERCGDSLAASREGSVLACDHLEIRQHQGDVFKIPFINYGSLSQVALTPCRFLLQQVISERFAAHDLTRSSDSETLCRSPTSF